MFGVRGVGSDRSLQLPCGQCVGCRLEHSRQWALRCVHEASLRDDNCFVTLTYDNAHLPVDLSVSVREWQLFAKRLRKSGPFRFFACGEYGDQSHRPHYHALVFGRDLRAGGELLKRSPEGDLYSSKLVSAAWLDKGMIAVGGVTFESAAYVARYVMKKYNGASAARAYERVDDETGEVWQVAKPFVVMSRRPGVGADWFSKYGGEIYGTDSVVWNGRKFRPPRYYDSKVDPAFLEGVKESRLARAEKHAKDMTPERLEVREQVTHARIKSLLRGIE